MDRARDDERDPLDAFEPAYRRAHREGWLGARVEAALALLSDCHVCPRNCGGDRRRSAEGTCRTGRFARVASAFPHFGEEPCLRGTRGSGTIFFSQCSLRCVFCQNWDISQHDAGAECTAADIAALMLALQSRGCHNVNLVTPSHVVPQIVEAIGVAAADLHVPLVYNTGSYDAVSSLRLLDGLVDIYMPDVKFWRPETGRRLAAAEDYRERMCEAVIEMHRQVGPLEVGPDGIARRGVLVRHLVMPGQGGEAAELFGWLAREVSPDTYVNVMGQYRPACRVGETADRGVTYSDIDRGPTPRELRDAFDAARRAGLWRFDTGV